MNEKALWFAVLRKAVEDAMGTFVPINSIGLCTEEARAWFTDWVESDNYPECSFPWICQYLDKDLRHVALSSGRRIHHSNGVKPDISD